MSLEETVREFLNAHPEARFVNKEVFYPAYYAHKFQQLLDYEALYPHLMNHNLVKNEEDIKRIQSAFSQPHDQHVALIELVERGGDYGFMLLYIYICATCKSSPDHSEVARILTAAGEPETSLLPI